MATTTNEISQDRLEAYLEISYEYIKTLRPNQTKKKS